ncbi:MAG: hypothetical protein ABIP77_08800 [Candidatus Limnocylindrales bacterium]
MRCDHRLSARHRRVLLVVLAVAAALVGPVTAAMAHPLGNFTINHYAGIRIQPDRVLLDVVIDEAEIPAFQSRQSIDLDDDDEITDQELRAGAETRCAELAPGLALTVGSGGPLPLSLQEAGLAFPLGASGLATLRLVCVFQAVLPATLSADAPTRISFADSTRPDRLGWREIVMAGDGVSLSAAEGELRGTSPSARLSIYPEDLLARPLADSIVAVDAIADPTISATPFDVPDAEPIGVADPSTAPGASPAATPAPSDAAVPGGIGGELPTIFRTAELTPVILLLSILTAAALGAGHALTPGHGKTLMAAYLVGTRGTSLHALGLGLSVSVSHTVGILLLAAIVVGAADVLPPDVVVRTAPLIAALSILAIGGWMLIGELRRRRSVAASARASAAAEREHAADHEHDHPHDHEHENEHPAHDAGEHAHGGVRHSHLPAAGSTITWRSLFVLGLAGGLIPSTSALLILLGSIAAGRPAFGFVLVVAFGLGMASVMTGIGLVMVFARGRLDRLPGGGGLGRVRDAVPLVAAVLVFGFGLYLTAQALGGATTL